MDALPFVKTVGQKPACYGLNSIGLKRKGFEPETIRRLEQAFRILVRSRPQHCPGPGADHAPSWPATRTVDYLIAFVESRQAGRPQVARRAAAGGEEASAE